MADKDINLVIKAKDQAKKAIDSVADALRDLTDVQNDVGQSASKTDGLLGRLKNELAALDKEARGLAALNKVATQLDRAAGAVGRLDAEVGRSTQNFDKLQQESRDAAKNVDLLRAAADEAKAAFDRQKAAVAGLTAEQRKDKAAVAEARAERERLATTLREANAALRTAETQERKLAAAFEQAANEAERSREALADANDELNQIAGLAQKASSALGGVEATQEAVAAASARAAAEMARINAAMGQTASRAGGVTVGSTKQSLAEWREAEAEVKRLAQAMRETEQPSREMQRDFLLAQQAARAAKTAYTEQRMELAQISAARRKAAESAQAETKEVREAAAAHQQYQATVRGTGNAVGAAANQNYRLRDAFRGVYGESRQAMNMFQRMRSEVLSLASAYVGLYASISALATVVQTMRSLEQAQNRLSVAFGGNQAAVGAEMQWLEGEASRLKMAFADLSAEYGKFAFSAKAAGFATDEMRTIFLGVAEGARVMGLSMDQVQGILKALDQIMSKGKVQAEELRGQLGDRLSGSFQLFAQAIGVSTQELDKMMEAGEVFATRSNMVAFGQKLRDTFGPQLAGALEATTAEISDFQANLQNAAHQVGEGGFWDALGDSLAEINAWFKSDEGAQFFNSIGVALSKLVMILPAVVDNFGLLTTIFQAFAAFKIAQVVMGIAGSMSGLSLNTTKAHVDVMALTMAVQRFAGTSSGPARAGLQIFASALVSLRGVMIGVAAAARTLWAALGGLPGLILTGVTFLISSLAGKWLTSVDSATEALNRHDEMINKVKAGYVEAKGEAQAWAKAIEDVTFTELKESGDEAVDTMEKMKDQALDQYFNELTFGLEMFSRTERDILKPTIEKFRDGTISAEEFRRQIDEIARANPNLDQKLVKALIETAQEAVKAERRIREVAAAIRAKGGAATEADRKLLDLADALDTVNASADTSAIDAYAAAMKKLGDAVPDLKVQTEFEAKKAALDASYAEALANAGTGTAESIRLMEEASTRYQAALKALNEEQARSGSGRSYIDKLASAEGTARNPRSSAVGFGQFTDGTWIDTMRRHMPKLFADTMRSGGRAAVLALKNDPQLARTMTELLTEQNAALLAGAGFAATDTNKYLAHFLGVGGGRSKGALDVLRADRSTPIEQVTNESARTSNPEVFRNVRTAGDLIDWSAGKMGVSTTQISAEQRVVDLLAEAKKKQDEFNAEIATGISQREFEIAQLGRSAKEQAVQLALREAQTKAAKDNVTFSDQQAEAIRQSVEATHDANVAERGRQAILDANAELLRAQGIQVTRDEYINNGLKEKGLDLATEEGRELAHIRGLLWDITEAEKARNKERERHDSATSSMEAQQQLLMEQVQFAQDQGDNAAAEALKLKLDELNLAYREALLAKRAFWETEASAGGPNADQATAEIARIDQTILRLDALKAKAITTGRDINQSIAAGLTGAIDKFAQAVAEGENAWRSFGDAFRQFAADFLRQIAQMIIQALILKILTGDAGGGNGGLGGWISNMVNGGVRHNGGMVGSGGGNRSVWAGYFANATRYHTGGIVGLKPNEVPIIAEKGEEVLDAGDPRHRDNLGGGAPVELKNVNVFDAADVLRYALADTVGQKVLLNFVRDNPRAFQSAMAT